MKPTLDIPDTLLDNDHEFGDHFYRRFTLRPMPEPLRLNDRVSKTYSFPTFYGDVTCAMAIFLCDYGRAAELVARKLHPRVKPVRATRGRAILAFSCYEYKKVMNVPPYNEIAVAIPVMVNATFRPPLLPMIISRFSRFGYYIASMPVTSEENRIRGNKIWGLPKVTQEIEITREGKDYVTVAKESDGTPYLRIVVETDGAPTKFDVTSNLYSRLDGRIMQGETSFKAEFTMKKFMGQLVRKGNKPERNYLEVGSTPSAALLRGLGIEPHPFQFRYAEGMTSCFDLPNAMPPAWLETLNRRWQEEI